MKDETSPQQLTVEQALSRAKKAAKKGNVTLALHFYNAVLQHLPNHPVAKKGLRKLQKGLPKNQQRAIEIQNPSQDQFNHLLNIYHSGDLLYAEKACKDLLKIYPQSLDVINLLGAILKEQGKLQEAVASFEKVIHLKPDYAEVYSNLGNALRDLGRLHAALAIFDKAIQIKPDYAEAYSNRGNVKQDLGLYQEALTSFETAIQLKPDYANAYCNRGSVLTSLGAFKEAGASFDMAIQIKPDFIAAYNNMLCMLNYSPNHTANDRLKVARKFGEILTGKVQKQFSSHQRESELKLLRVGFVSGDFKDHPVGYFLENVLSSLDPSRIELIAYPTTANFDSVSERIKPYFSRWSSIHGLSDEAAASLIYADGIHILLDLAGHTVGNRLPVFAYKPSPIQVSWLGYFATTGLNEMDYLLGDPYATPPKYDQQFTEKVWRLPETRWCFTPPDVDVGVSMPPAIDNSYVTFGSFNNLVKINYKVLALWAKVLSAIPDSRLLLKTGQLQDQSVRDRIIERLTAQGISCERITFEEPEERSCYFSAYNRVDITLDPFPFTGGTTSVESLWMGVPIVTLAGDSLVSRQGVGVLQNADLAEWIAKDEEDYLAKAILFASDLDKLTKLRAELRSQVLASPLFDAPRFARNFENALWGMWNQRNCVEGNTTEY